MIDPHGGKLVEREMSEEKREKIISHITDFYRILIDAEQTQEIENIAQGVYLRRACQSSESHRFRGIIGSKWTSGDIRC